MSVMLPVSVTVTVCAEDNEDNNEGDEDWTIQSVLRANVEATPRLLTENMSEDDRDEFYRLIGLAKDEAV